MDEFSHPSPAAPSAGPYADRPVADHGAVRLAGALDALGDWWDSLGLGGQIAVAQRSPRSARCPAGRWAWRSAPPGDISVLDHSPGLASFSRNSPPQPAAAWPDAQIWHGYPLAGTSFRAFVHLPDARAGPEMAISMEESGQMISLEYGSPGGQR